MKRLSMKLYLIVFMLLITNAFAQTPEITNGLNYLSTTQNPDGSWDSNTTDILPATREVLETFQILNETSSLNYTDAIAWLQNQNLETTDYLSRRIYAFLVGGTDIDVLLSYLDELELAWGGYDDYKVNILDTTLALQALKAINHPDIDTISNAIGYLIINQNPDGGWGFPSTSSGQASSGSNVYMTALVLKTFTVHSSLFNVQSSIDSAVSFLISKKNPDGGISDSASTVYETALAFDALVVSNADISSISRPAIDYLLNTQLVNGSWDDDPYSTALALRALASVKPNLTVSSNDIIFSDPAPTVGDTITVSATVLNTGTSQAENVLVSFYDGAPALNGVLIGEATIASVPAFGSAQADINWTIPIASAQIIYVFIDPLNSIDELDESDNSASKNLTTATLPDLSITHGDVTLAPLPPLPGENVTISATVRNKGETAAGNVTVHIYDGDPSAGALLLGSITFPVISAGAEETFILNTTFTAGLREIHISVDINNSIIESNEDNNDVTVPLQVGTGWQDLSVLSNGIFFSPLHPVDGETVDITAHIFNESEIEVTNIFVKYYLGNPDLGGTEIRPGTVIFIPSIPARSGVPVIQAWDSTAHAGDNEIYVKVDPGNAISESNETNNKAFRILTVAVQGTGPDFTLLSSGINIVPQSPVTGDTVTISANISNTGVEDAGNVPVEFSLGDPEQGGSLIIATETISFIAIGETVNVVTTWDTTGFTGTYDVYVNADPHNDIYELDEFNNKAYVSVAISDPQGPDLTVSEIDTANLLTDNQTLDISGSLNVTIENKGNQDSVLAFTITVFEDINRNQAFDSGTDNVITESAYTGNLIPGALDTVTLAVTGNVLFRDNLIYAFVDSANAINETDETNNMRHTGQECEYIPPVGTFNPVEKWTWTGSNVLPTYDQVASSPVVASLTDDNNDGLINELDIPDVIFISAEPGDYTGNAPGVIRAVSGDNGAELFTITNLDYGIVWTSMLAVGDIDGDGIVEIIGYKPNRGMIAFEHDGTFKWESNEGFGNWSAPVIADIDSDGIPEIISGDYVFNNDGTERWRGGAGEGNNYFGRLPLTADIDLDGFQEVVAGNTAYKNDGTILWWHWRMSDGFDAVGNFDDDPYPEIVFVSRAKVYLFEHTGEIIWGPVYLPEGGRGGPPTIADFDGDGQPEIGVAGRLRYIVFDTDGSILWQSVTQDISSGVTGSSVFDFDGDGQVEVVYNDELYLRIYKGSTGQILFSTPNSTATAIEYPVIADIDNDNRAEIIVAANDYDPRFTGFHGIRVFEDADDNWVNTRKIWNQHTYHITNVNDDGTIPRHEENNWETYNNYRCNALLPDEVFGTSDITVSYITADQTNFPTSVEMSARIGNGGAVSRASGVDVSFYDGDPQLGGLLIGTVQTSLDLEKGDYEDVSVLWNTPSSGDHDIYAVADEANIFNECREDNNTAFTNINIGAVVGPPPEEDLADLSVSQADITIIPPDSIEGQPAVIAAIIHNIGAIGASNVEISFFDGDPLGNGELIGTITKSFIDSGANALAEIPWNTFGQSGRNYIHVAVDLENVIPESNENNNTSLISLDVVPPSKPDLVVTSSDIVFSNLQPEEGDPLTLSAVIHNFGTVTAGIEVYLYDGDPSSGGTVLAQKTIPQIIQFGDEITLDFDIDTVGFSGSHSFYISIDPNNTIDEVSETNNMAWDSLVIGPSGISLAVSTDKSEYSANEDVQITVSIGNLLSSARTGTLEVKITDLGDNVASVVTTDYALTLGPDENRVINFTWNTNSILAGSYRVYTHFSEEGNITAKAFTSISITPVKSIASKVTADKISYPANQDVTITSQITGTSPNYIFENLLANISVTNNQGDILYTESRAIPILLPGQLVEFKTYWNTAQNPEGAYGVSLEIMGNPSVLSASTAAFDILGTNDTGEGLTGDIAVSLNPVYQGQDQVLTYTITNTGNEDIPGLDITVLIVDPETLETKNTFENTVSLPMNTTFTGNFTASTLPLMPKTYLAILQASTDVMPVQTLASAVFEVKPGIEITKTIPDVSNLLVWVNKKCKDKDHDEDHDRDHDAESSRSGENDNDDNGDSDNGDGNDEDDKECIRLDLLETILGTAVSDYYIVYGKKEFQEELRNPYYTDFLILGKHYTLEDHLGDELREQVYSGKGIVSSLWLKHGDDHEEDEHYNSIFGIRFKGHLSGNEQEVELFDSPVSEAGLLDTIGKAAKVEAGQDTVIAGLLMGSKSADSKDNDDGDNEDGDSDDEDDNNDNDDEDKEYPAIVLNEYGEGKAVYFAFDLGLTLNDENYAQVSDLINRSISYVHNSSDAATFYPGQLIPVEISITSLGSAFDLRIIETYPPEIKLYDLLTDQ